MQKGQPAGRLSGDKDHLYRHEVPSGYAEGFSAGYEAGRRASLGESTQQRVAGSNGQRFSAGTDYQRSSSQGKKGFTGAQHTPVKTFQYQINKGTQQQQQPSFERHFDPRNSQNGGRLSDGFQGRKSLDDHIHNREHDMNGHITNPQEEVHFNARGHY